MSSPRTMEETIHRLPWEIPCSSVAHRYHWPAIPPALASWAVRAAMGVLLNRAETLAASGAVVALAPGGDARPIAGKGQRDSWCAGGAGGICHRAGAIGCEAGGAARPDPRQETLSERPRPARVAEPPGQRDLKLPEHGWGRHACGTRAS
jgi:hypothetical protein